MKRALSAVVVIGMVLAGLSNLSQARPVSLEEAVRLGIEHSPELRVRMAEVRKAGASKASARGRLGPILGVDAAVQRFDEPQDMALDLDSLGLGIEIPPFRVQDRTIYSVGLHATQVLTPLYSLYNLYRMEGAGEEASRLEVAATRDQVRYRITESFFRLRQAVKLAEVAQQAVATVEAHLKSARHFQAAGAVGRDDVLRAETALARAQDGVNQATAGVELARAALNIQMGLPTDEPTTLAGDDADPPPELSLTEADAVSRGVTNRADLRAMEQRVRMADAGRQAAIGAMLPNISARFQYNYQKGNRFADENLWFVGGFLSWNFWEWGATWYRIDMATADRVRVEEAVAGLRDAITLDVRKAWLDLRTARASMATWRKGIESSEENLRVVTRKYEAASATSVEVLDAQTSLTQAQSQYQVALATWYTALANLHRAMGEP